MRKKTRLRQRAARQAYLNHVPSEAGKKWTAYHEAGHTVHAVKHGLGVEMVTIDPARVKELTGHSGVGYTQYKNVGLGHAEDVLRQQVVGMTSEAYVRDGQISGCQDDLQTLDAMFAQLNLVGLEKERTLTRIKLQAQEFVQDSWAAIKAVADALVEHQTLVDSEVDEIIAGAESTKNPGMTS